MAKILKLIDIFPQQFTFTYKGRKFLKTNWGGVISILAFFAILINAALIGNDIYYKVKPNVIQITKEEKLTPNFRINNNNTRIGLAISGTVDILDYESYLQVVPYYHLQILNKKKNYYQGDIFWR